MVRIPCLSNKDLCLSPGIQTAPNHSTRSFQPISVITMADESTPAPKKLFKPLDKSKSTTPPIKKKIPASPAAVGTDDAVKNSPKSQVQSQAHQGASSTKVSHQAVFYLIFLLSPTLVAIFVMYEHRKMSSSNHQAPITVSTSPRRKLGLARSTLRMRVRPPLVNLKYMCCGTS